MMVLSSEQLNEIVGGVVVLGVGLLKKLGDKLSEKAAKEELERHQEGKTELDEMEVLSKEDFRELIETVQKANVSIEKGKDCFEDTLACMSIISTLVNIIKKNPVMLTLAQDQIFTFLRHADFPSKDMVTAAFELTIGEINDANAVATTLDPGTGYPTIHNRRRYTRSTENISETSRSTGENSK